MTTKSLSSPLSSLSPSQSVPASRAVTVVAATGLVALCAHIASPLPFTPVPTTMQTFAVLLLGLVLGPATAAAAMVLYLLEGAAGLPVFASTGLPGLAHLLGPTAGFLLSYPVAAFLAGTSRRRLEQETGVFAAAILGGVAGLFPVFGLGAVWLAFAVPTAAQHVMQLAVLPFLPGEAIKVLLAAVAASALARLHPTR